MQPATPDKQRPASKALVWSYSATSSVAVGDVGLLKCITPRALRGVSARVHRALVLKLAGLCACRGAAGGACGALPGWTYEAAPSCPPRNVGQLTPMAWLALRGESARDHLGDEW
jgi:hypothetical protein